MSNALKGTGRQCNDGHREGWDAYQLATRERREVGNRFLIGHASLVKYPAFDVILIDLYLLVLKHGPSMSFHVSLRSIEKSHHLCTLSLWSANRVALILIPVLYFASEGTVSSSN